MWVYDRERVRERDKDREEGKHTLVFLSKCWYGKVRGWPGVSVFPFLFKGCFETCLRALMETWWFK